MLRLEDNEEVKNENNLKSPQHEVGGKTGATFEDEITSAEPSTRIEEDI